MAETENKQITERELREAELQMTGRPPVATGFIGFVPAAPGAVSENDNAAPKTSSDGAKR
jgi:hypothetical protein